ncbi:acyl-CoA dehydrogenase family protein [Candidatus Poriferisocius sp.]|uniref:acyl-CoA dehydrogenase family protein n=1 Tax=Candidatus Poriferisocius sp. TaxID=3101276 RepID=UPI003B0164E9
MTITREDFQIRAREFLEANAAPRSQPPVGWTERELVAECRRFHQALADAELGGITYPVEYGGLGLDKGYLEVFNRELSQFQAPLVPAAISHGMCLPVLNDFGTPEQRDRHQSRVIRCDEIWCQMFSEPGAGSDVASLATRAIRDGDQWVLNGQKVWTSGAQYCEYGLCVARTDPAQPKHRGLSMFIVDLSLPGVDIRPLRQISGSSHFNEVYLSDVRVGHDCLVGGEGNGWNVAVAMLMYERVAIGAGGSGAMSQAMGSAKLIKEARKRGRDRDPVVRDSIADLYIRERIQTFIGMRIRQAAASGKAPGPEGSIAKLNTAILSRRASDAAIELAGPAGQAWDAAAGDAAEWASAVISAPAMAIAGGTNEVQRNIIGERVLGLPKEPDPFKGQPWEEVPRS